MTERVRRSRTVARVCSAVMVITMLGCTTGERVVKTPDDPTTDDVAGLRFTDVAEASGLAETHSTLALEGQADMTSGAAVADIDGDGDQDIFLPRVGQPNRMMLNDGGGVFTDVAREAGVSGPSDRYGSSTGVFFDIEGDGDLDLFVTGYGPAPNELFVNDGAGKFDEQSMQRGLTWPPLAGEHPDGRHHGSAVADVDGNGFLDLLVLEWYTPVYDGEVVGNATGRPAFDSGGDGKTDSCAVSRQLKSKGFAVPADAPPTRSRLFLNDGGGSFVDATSELELPLNEIVAFTGTFGDIDADGWMDLAITGDGCTSRLFRNDGGTKFVDLTESAGVGTDENGMGSILRDVNGDGLIDWFITSISYDTQGEACPVTGFSGCSGNRLYVNNGDLTFRDATDELDVRDGGWGWGVAGEDFANRGTIDLVMTNGFRLTPKPGKSSGSAETDFVLAHSDDADRFWAFDGDTFVEVAESVGLDDNAVGHALVPFDMDGDGDLDLLIVPSGSDSPRLYRNDSAPSDRWLSVTLDDPTRPGNRWGDGARVELTTKGGDTFVADISTSGSYESQRPPIAHFGVDDASEPLEQLVVTWPGGQRQVIKDVALGQLFRVARSTD